MAKIVMKLAMAILGDKLVANLVIVSFSIKFYILKNNSNGLKMS